MARNRLLFFCCLIALAATLSACGAKKSRTAQDKSKFIRTHDLNTLPRFDVPVEINDRVIAWLEYFQGPGSGHFRRYLERSGRYMPLMTEILKDSGMPKDLIYVALIESGFNTQAYSRAAAVGPWQFINSTGRRYGLRIDSWVDERRDPYKSTVAAMSYLRDLYTEFGDWYLAMAAYNAGEGRIRQAIEITGSRNFWELARDRRALRPETRDYVPKFIAAAIIAKMPENFGFYDVGYREPFDYDTAAIETQTDFAAVAKCAGVSEDDILDLNPHLYRGVTPPGAYDYKIRIPKGKAKLFQERYAALPKEERIRVVRYEVRRGDTLVRVAKRFGISASALARANNLSLRSKHLSRGTTLVIPTGGKALYAKYEDQNTGKRKKSRVSTAKFSQTRHTVRQGETLGKIASRYGVSVKQLMAWNNIKDPRKIHKGKGLVVRRSLALPATTAAVSDETGVVQKGARSQAAAGKGHVVKRGETLATIARRYGVTVKQIMALNDIKDPKRVRSGVRLAIRTTKTAPEAGEPIRVADAGGEEKSEQTRKIVPTEKSLAQKVAANDRSASTSLSDQLVGGTTVAALPTGTTNTNTADTNVGPTSNNQEAKAVNEVKGDSRTTTPATTPERSPASQKPLTYKVKNGDTLWDIARRHKVTIAQIQKWNNLSDPSAVKPGETLTIHQE